MTNGGRTKTIKILPLNAYALLNLGNFSIADGVALGLFVASQMLNLRSNRFVTDYIKL
jgi:hypothetical protein